MCGLMCRLWLDQQVILKYMYNEFIILLQKIYSAGLMFIIGASTWFYFLKPDSNTDTALVMVAGALNGIGGSTILILSLSLTADLIDQNTVSIYYGITSVVFTITCYWLYKKPAVPLNKVWSNFLVFGVAFLRAASKCCLWFISGNELTIMRSNWIKLDLGACAFSPKHLTFFENLAVRPFGNEIFWISSENNFMYSQSPPLDVLCVVALNIHVFHFPPSDLSNSFGDALKLKIKICFIYINYGKKVHEHRNCLFSGTWTLHTPFPYPKEPSLFLLSIQTIAHFSVDCWVLRKIFDCQRGALVQLHN